MPVKRYRSKKRVTGRRRLQPTIAGIATAAAKTAVQEFIVKPGVSHAKAKASEWFKSKKSKGIDLRSHLSKPVTSPAIAKRNYQLRLNNTDNVTTIPAIVVGTPKKLTFEEKVRRITNVPNIIKRVWNFTAEVTSGKKAFFQLPFNNNTSGLTYDINNLKASYTSNTGSSDATVNGNSTSDMAKFFIDYCSNKLQFVNSSSNSVYGKIHFIGVKQNTAATYDNASFGDTIPLTPINMSMFYSTNGTVNQNQGFEGIVGNGYRFHNNTAGSSTALTWALNAQDGNNYSAPYSMPGSALHSTAIAALTDTDYNLFGTNFKESLTYYFRPMQSIPFSLKPGQQINQSVIFNDLPYIHRETYQYEFLRGITYWMVVEFQAGVVGDSASSNVTTGSGQISVIREEKRVMGLHNPRKSQLVMPNQTSSGNSTLLTSLALANQVTINPDSGVQDTGAEIDS